MKKYLDYLKEIERVKSKIIPVESSFDFNNRWSKRLNGAKKEEIETLMRERDAEIEKAIPSEKINSNLKLILAVMANNKKALLFECVMPYILQILKDYNGKQYGDKTRDKMKERLKSETGCAFYMTEESYSGTSICFAMLDSKGCCYGNDWVKVYSPYEKRVLNNNKINGDFEIKDFHTYDFKPFIEDPISRVLDVELARIAADRARQDYDKAVHAYNALLVSGMNELETPKFHPNGILKY